MQVDGKMLALILMCAIAENSYAQNSNVPQPTGHNLSYLQKQFPLVFNSNLNLFLNGKSVSQHSNVNADSDYVQAIFLISSMLHKPVVQKYAAPYDWKFTPEKISFAKQTLNTS